MFQFFTHYRLTFLLFAIVLLLLGGMFALYYVGNESDSKLIIYSKTVPTLYPHAHDIGDSLFDPDHHIRVLSDVLMTQQDFWITSFELVLQNAPSQVVHHAGILIPNEANRTCPNAKYGREIYAASTADVSKPIVFENPYAMFIPKGTPLVLEVLYHNPFEPFGPGEIYENVSASVIMTLQQDDFSSISKTVEYHRIHIEDIPCPGVVDEEVFIVPANTNTFIKESTKDEELDPSFYTFSQSGTITYMGAHFHPWEGQEKLDVFLNNKEIATFLAARVSSELWSWMIPHSQSSFHVNSGDVISFSTTNSNPNPIPIIGAMGTVVFYFAPDLLP